MIQLCKQIFNKILSFTNTDKSQGQNSKDDYIPTQLEVWKFIIKFMGVDWKLIFLINLRLLISTLIQIRSPFVMLDIKNALIENDTNQMFKYICEYIFYKVISSASNYYQYVWNDKCFSYINTQAQSKILSHLLTLDLSYFEENKVTQLSSLVNSGAQRIAGEVHKNKFFAQINHCINMLGRVYFIFCISKSITLAMFLICLTFSIIDNYFSKAVQKQQNQGDDDQDFQRFALDDIMNNIHLIKSFGNEQKELKALTTIAQKNAQLQKNIRKLDQIQYFISTFKVDLVTLVVIFQIFLMRSSIISQDYKNQANNLAEMISIQHSITFLIHLVQNNEVDKRSKNIGKLIKLFSKHASIPQNIDEQDIIKLQGDIEFQNVCFKYPKIDDTLAKANQKLHQKSDSEVLSSPSLKESSELSSKEEELKQEQNTLSNVTFQIKQGQLVAFVGKSGSGKSTIAKMLMRCYDPNSGNILFDGQNSKDFSIRRIKQSIGYVSQEPTLFDNDIEFNITYGCLNGKFTQEEIKRVCDISGVSEFVFDKKRFPQGLQTLIGANGVKLSGGQKQRVALARALMKNPNILILDEATSSLDAESEHVVQKYIDQLVEQRGMTIILIAHRLSTIVKSDVIFVMEQGQIKEQGTHQSLIQMKGIYEKLINRQMSVQDQDFSY